MFVKGELEALKRLQHAVWAGYSFSKFQVGPQTDHAYSSVWSLRVKILILRRSGQLFHLHPEEQSRRAVTSTGRIRNLVILGLDPKGDQGERHEWVAPGIQNKQ